MLSRVGLRQLVVLLVLTSLLVAAGNMFWASSSLHQQALREHDLQRQLGFAQQLAGRLQLRAGKEPLAGILDSLVMDDQLQVWVTGADGKLLYPAGAELSASQRQTLATAGQSYSAMVPDEQGHEQMTSVISLPDSSLRLMVQTPASGQMPLNPDFGDMLVYSLPAALLLMVLAWLAGGRMARPFRALASYTRALGKDDSLSSIQALEPSSREAAELKSGLLQGVKQIKGAELHKPPACGADPLTGLCTPDILPELVTNISLGGTSFSVVVLAVDDYDQIQEHFTPQLRNPALKQLAGLLLHHSRELDISVRMGEEVFLLLLPQCPVVIAQRIAERLRSKVQDHPFDGVGHLTISAGVAMFEPGRNDPLGSLKEAQKLLISARRQGQNRVHVMP